MGMKENMESIHEKARKDMGKRLSAITDGSNLEQRELFMASALLHQKELSGEFEYSLEKGNAQMQVKMSKFALIQMAAEIAESVFEDEYEFISMMLAYNMVKHVIDKQTGKKPQEVTTIDCNGKTQAEIDLMKEMFKKSPEELAKLREQLNE
jgi:hypothetical protein